jgi:hypothetical protein
VKKICLSLAFLLFVLFVFCACANTQAEIPALPPAPTDAHAGASASLSPSFSLPSSQQIPSSSLQSGISLSQINPKKIELIYYEFDKPVIFKNWKKGSQDAQTANTLIDGYNCLKLTKTPDIALLEDTVLINYMIDEQSSFFYQITIDPANTIEINVYMDLYTDEDEAQYQKKYAQINGCYKIENPQVLNYEMVNKIVQSRLFKPEILPRVCAGPAYLSYTGDSGFYEPLSQAFIKKITRFLKTPLTPSIWPQAEIILKTAFR